MKDDILLNVAASIREAMRAIELGTLRTVFVLSEQNKLIGSISDGDIRRGLLKDLNMSDSVLNIMNKNPIFLLDTSSKEDRIKLIKKLDLTCLPIISKNQEIIDVVTLRSLLKYEKRDNPVFIMAGGFGTRLKPLTNNCPKPMLPVGSKPILEHLINRLSTQGFYKLFISTHFLPQIIRDYFKSGKDWDVEITYVHEDIPLGTAGALSLLKNPSELPLVMINGDVLTDIDFTRMIDFHTQNSFDCTICLRELEHQISFGVVDTSGTKVLGMREKPTYSYDINTGIYVLSKRLVTTVPKNQVIDMPTHIEDRVLAGDQVGAMRHSGYWLDIGSMTDYHKAQRDIESLDF